jgi:hypothetical protein
MPGNIIGIRTISLVPAGVTTISNTTLATVAGLSFPILAGSIWSLRFVIPFSTGATGGAKFQVIAPAAPTFFVLDWALYLGGTPGTLADTAVQTSSAAFSNALAAATNHYMTANCVIQSSVAGTIGLQFAQLTSVAAALTLLQDGYMDVVQLK